MQIIASLVAMAAAASALSQCPLADVMFFNGNASSTDYAWCGDALSTNCAQFGSGAFCSLYNTSAIQGGITAVCCNATTGVAYDVAQKDTCTTCLKDNTANSTPNTWDGSSCFNNDNLALYPGATIPNTVVYTDKTKCPADCFASEFIGTCWRRCGTRGWGVDPSKGYGGYVTGATYGYMSGYASYSSYMGSYMGGYMMGGYASMGYYGGYYNQGMGYMGGYAMGGYAMGGYMGGGAYYTPYGMSPSIYGAPCPDPKQISQFPTTPAFPQPWGWGGYMGGYMGGYAMGGYMGGYAMGGYMGGYAMGGYMGGYAMGGYMGGYATMGGYMGGYATMGGYMGGYATMGQPQFVGSVYGRQFVGSIYGGGVAQPGFSVYGGGMNTGYGGSVYGGSQVYGGSVYGNTNQPGEHRCDAALQCSCDENCCERGDCCKDVDTNACHHSH